MITSCFPVKAFDTHAHVGMDDFDLDRESVLQRARDLGIGFLEVSYDESSSARSVRLSRSLGVPVALGIHPHHSSVLGHDGEATWVSCEKRWRAIGDLVTENPGAVVALGEMGLDYYRDLSPKNAQIGCFKEGLALARDLCLPVIIHQRDAEEDTLRVLSEFKLGSPIVFHCFSQDRDYARRCFGMGGYFGIGGALTFKNNQALREVVAGIPSDRLLTETDCPYLAPTEYRGKRNEPAYMLKTIETLSRALNKEPEFVMEQTLRNAKQVFGDFNIKIA